MNIEKLSELTDSELQEFVDRRMEELGPVTVPVENKVNYDQLPQSKKNFMDALKWILVDEEGCDDFINKGSSTTPDEWQAMIDSAAEKYRAWKANQNEQS